MRYLLKHPTETRPSLLVEVVTTTDEEVLGRVRTQMLATGCANALVIDPREVRILRDTFSEMGENAIQLEGDALDTDLLIGGRGELPNRVRAWLDRMSENWNEALPREDWAAPLFYDVVPALSGSIVDAVEPDAA